MTLNWKTLARLVGLGLAVYLVAPNLPGSGGAGLGVLAGSLPLLLFVLACPLMMVFMMKGMGGMQGMNGTQQAGAQQAAVATELGQPYTCPMHPEVRSEQPGRCPRCDMALVPAAAPTPQQAAVPAMAATGSGVGASREAELGLLRAQLQVLNEQRAALAAQLDQLQESEPPSRAVEEAERIAEAAARRR